MPYGDTGLGGAARGYFTDPLPWDVGQVIAKDATTGKDVARDVKFRVVTGAALDAIDIFSLQGTSLTFLGVWSEGAIGFGKFKGVTIKVQAMKGGKAVDITYAQPFALSLSNPVDYPPILGSDLFIGNAVTVSVNYNAKTVQITI